MDDYISKPVSIMGIRTKINQWSKADILKDTA